MNMNKNIVNRALYYAGQEQLKERDFSNKDKSEKYQICKSFYISTFLEALSELEWVNGRKRKKLVPTGRPIIKDTRYRYAYDLPFDCAKPVELQDNEYFIIEDKLLLTDEPKAELLYVSNGKVMRPVSSLRMQLGMIEETEYITAGPPGTIPEVTFHPGNIKDLPKEGVCHCHVGNFESPECKCVVELPSDPQSDEDYPDYEELDYEPKFFQYIEKMLAAKFAIKVTDQPRLHTQLLQEAMIIKHEAVAASRSKRAAKRKEDVYWTDQMGVNLD